MQVHVIATDQNLRIILDEPQPDQEIFDLPELRSEDEDASENRNGIVHHTCKTISFEVGTSIHAFDTY